MSYELQVHARSPVRPSVAELLGQASASGLRLELAGRPAGGLPSWSALALRAAGEDGPAFTVEVSPELCRVQEAFRADREGGDAVPDEVLEASTLYVLELDQADDEAEHEAQLAAFVVAAWALATLVEGIVFDPQEEIFADAESFWALVMDEEAAPDGSPPAAHALRQSEEGA